MADDNVKEIRSGRTKESLRKAIEGELTDVRVKEMRGRSKLVEKAIALVGGDAA